MSADPQDHGNNGADVFEDVVYQRLSTIPARAVDWLWPGKIAKGKVSMIVGNPGLGKSQVCASLAVVVSIGGQWPVDRTRADQGSVIILSAEDDVDDTIRPRLEAAGANLDCVYILKAIKAEDEKGDSFERGFSLIGDTYRLGALIKELGDVQLVIIDPITAYLGSADSHKNAEVRALLAPLQTIAQYLRVAILAVSHLTKASGIDALQRVQGSVAFAAAARAVWGVTKDKDSPQRRLFLPLKNNLGVDTSGYAYSIESHVLEGSDPPIGTSVIMWESAKITTSAEEAFGQQAKDYNEHSDIEDAKDFLRGLLADGPVPQRQVEADSKGAGHAWATIRRAQKNLNIEAFKEGFKAPWLWSMPGRRRDDPLSHTDK